MTLSNKLSITCEHNNKHSNEASPLLTPIRPEPLSTLRITHTETLLGHGDLPTENTRPTEPPHTREPPTSIKQSVSVRTRFHVHKPPVRNPQRRTRPLVVLGITMGRPPISSFCHCKRRTEHGGAVGGASTMWTGSWAIYSADPLYKRLHCY